MSRFLTYPLDKKILHIILNLINYVNSINMAKKLYIKIKQLRKNNKFSQSYIAKELGISRPTYIQIENGERELTFSEINKLADIFGISVEELISEKKYPRKISVFLDKKPNQKVKKPEMRINVPQSRVGKFKEVLLYILDKVGAKPNVGETVLYKLLYFIDFDFYEKYEEQLIGATYIKNFHGPTPVEFKKIMQDMEKKGEIEQVKSKYFQYPQKKYLPHREADLRKLTAREVKHIDEVLARLSEKNANELSEYSHNDVPWIIAENNKPLEYEAVFYRTDEMSVRNYEDNV